MSTDLLTQLETAETPTREMFYRAANFGTDKGTHIVEEDLSHFEGLLDAEAWTDAAMMLLNPDWGVKVTKFHGIWNAVVSAWRSDFRRYDHIGDAMAKHPALAFLAAIVRARG